MLSYIDVFHVLMWVVIRGACRWCFPGEKAGKLGGGEGGDGPLKRATLESCSLPLLLAGCTVGPDYHKTDIATPESFAGRKCPFERAGRNGQADLTRWWTIFP